MFYREQEEIIIERVLRYGLDTDQRSNRWKYVTVQQKNDLRHTIEQKIDRIVAEGEFVAHTKNEEINFMSEVMNRVPMYCNFLTASTYKRILFVGHHDVGDTRWYWNNRNNDSNSPMQDDFPPERSGERYFPNLNKVFQFIPLIMHHFNYGAGFSYVRPPESRHRAITNTLYDEMLPATSVIRSSRQYKHGIDRGQYNLDRSNWDGIKFDAVVFLGVPQHPDSSTFDYEEVKRTFSHYITSDCHFVDLWYGSDQSYSTRFQNANDHNLGPERSLGEVFHVRGSWDRETRDEGRPQEYDLMKKVTNVYSSLGDKTWRLTGRWPNAED